MGIRVNTTFTGMAGGPWYNSLAFTGTTLANAQDAADAVLTFWTSVCAYMKCGGTATVEPEVTIYSDATGEATGVFNTTPSTPISIPSGSGMLPTATQLLMRLRTGVFAGGREIRGRIFVPALDESANDSGRPNSGIITPMALALTTLISDTDSVLAVYSKKAGTTAVVNGGSVWNEWAQLRTRRDN